VRYVSKKSTTKDVSVAWVSFVSILCLLHTNDVVLLEMLDEFFGRGAHDDVARNLVNNLLFHHHDRLAVLLEANGVAFNILHEKA